MNEKLAIRSKRKREESFQQSKEAKKSCRSDLPDDDDTAEKSMECIYRDVRRQIVKWQRSQEGQIAQLKEHDHFTIHIQIEERKGQAVSIRCEMCGKKYSLSNVNGQLKVSNWTKHVKKCCSLKPKKKEGRVDEYFQPTDSRSGPSFRLAPPTREGKQD